MATIDSLDIKISASAQKANKAIDTLISNLGNLSNQLGKLNGSNFSNFSNGMKTLADGMKTFQGIKISDFTRVAKGIEKIQNIDAGKISSLGTSITTLANGLNALNGLSFNAESLNGISSALNKLGTVKATAGVGNLLKIKDSLSQFVRGMNSIGSVTFDVANLSNLISSISRLGNTSANNATKNLPAISAQLQNFVRQLNQIGSLSFDTTNLSNLITSISRLGNKTVANAIANLPQLTTELNNLMVTLSRAPTVSTNTILMTNALANLASQGNRIGSTSKLMTSSLNGVSNSMKKTTKSTKGLASAIGSFYAKFFWVIRGIKILWKSIGSSMSYIENLNYFNKAFSQVAEKANLSSWKELGYDSADAYYNSFVERAEQVTSKLTGYTISDSGMAINTGLKSLGLNPSEVMNYQAMFGQMASSMGVASETALKMSQALTEIGADLASVKNLDFNKVWTDMASGLAGKQ